ncbi:SSL2 DNA or RNA helicase of superfamily II [Pyrenophora tritici-repentis]|uniref:DNA 3'-5' helicase n=2 Tax=Pyrenophora tritici-repentis TaxID=45151 RepID=A0A2W1E7I7_9PLEO|nr:TFIIH basal transcription factor complex helicase XPB subunit [Pyrenophora tritici-repentis Pt-1C-BFP]KAA8618206.1 TFIIH basal transcription factor complex helicase XPB subunit [Pyrenophora tritici-repentis]EDU44076.1 TFIIH basal transcription factor complex helicase XPB subunit [Pyrenophora tritici-repentis Pt-1C-BFP]KAF7442832.1 TFIIH basal transcription factor complex helicase XPB protein [Pyrenophora tritici-repentis]KAF7568712.1 SSL2, DNA or RNA helicase superfamily II [Pyrenophora trit
MPPKRKAPTAADVAAEDDWDDNDEGPMSDQDTFDQLKEEFDVKAMTKRARAGRVRDAAADLFRKSDQWSAPLKPDHFNRPLWVNDAGGIILESFHPLFDEAQDFLINIAEPQSRVSKMHEYQLTTHSLFAAVSVGHSKEEIIDKLDRYSKTALSAAIIQFVEKSTSAFGKAKIVLKKTLSYIESEDPAILQKLLRDPIVAGCRADATDGLIKEAAPKIGQMAIPGTKLAAGANNMAQQPQPEAVQNPAPSDMVAALREDDDDDEVAQVHSFQIRSEEREKVVKRCRAIGLPLTEEYDFNNDDTNPNLEIDLKPHAQIRYYQEKALGKMFSNSRARSGIIVLPCGAGKTLVGITAACGVKKSVMVLCTSAMSVVQWRAEFIKWSNINPEDIAVFTADNKTRFPRQAGIIISTYSMISNARKRSHDAEKVMQFIREREWGLLIADEVHVVPANIFKKVTYEIASHAKLGLTATLLREDDKIDDLNFLIGPKLYEANWQELSEQGHIAKVQCAEVWCQMTPEFYTEWLKPSSLQKRALLSIMNPKKFQACQFLINYHESRGDKIIVFSDNVYALEKYSRKLGKAYIYGATPQQERLRILENFQHNDQINTIFLSKIGDTSLDLPEATCLIQISSHYGSRRQEAQRLGRILRAKRRNDEGFNAFFYSLVSKDTDEMYYSSKRQAFLVDQGYAFKVITRLEGLDSFPQLAFATPQERRELLTDVVLAKEEDAKAERIEDDAFGTKYASQKGNRKKNGVRRAAGTLSEFSGGQTMAYMEVNKSRNKDLKGTKGVQNAFLRKLGRSGPKK